MKLRPKLNRDTRSFFGSLGALAGTTQQENQFSRTFRVCFEQSPFVRRQVLGVLRTACRIKTDVQGIAEWNCAVEVPTPLGGGGRPAIRLSPASEGRRRAPVFYLESKLASSLTLEQLRRYRKHGVDYLIAVTKNPPEVSREDILRAGAFTVRWQDIHRQLLAEPAPAPHDRFIACSLTEYMEELGMAYREDLTLKDLDQCRRVLKAVASQNGEISPRNGFEIGDACLGLLRDVKLRFSEAHPAISGYHGWGPGYFNWSDEKGNRFHALGWDLWGRKWSEDRFGLRLWFPENLRTPLFWSVQRSGSKVMSEKYEEIPVKSTVSAGGTINQAALLSWVNKFAKRWKLG